VCSSASNFLVILLVARGAASTSIFGAFTVAFGVLTFVLTMSRSTLGVPLGTDLHRLDATDGRTMVARSLACGLALGGVVTVLLLGASAVLPDLDADLRTALVALAVLAPIVVVQDVGRYVSIARWRPGLALRSDALWLAVILTAFVGDLGGAWHLTVTSTVVCWGLGALLALAALVAVLARPSSQGVRGWLLGDPRRRHLFTDSVLAAATPLVVALIVTFLASAAVLGSVRGATTLLSPLNIAITAVGLTLIPDASRRDERGARRLMAAASVLLALVTLVWTGALLALPDSVGISLLGNIWEPAKQVIPVAAVEYVGLAAWVGAESYLRARHQTLLQLRFRYLYAVVALGAALTATLVWSSPRAVAAAAALAAVVVSALAWWRILTATPSPRPPPAPR
jgi:O-antigen/teichoic acid export membrane protein